MPLLFAIDPTNYPPKLFELGTALVLLFLGWLLRGLADRRSQVVLFDHRLRLEKEYALYSDLWEKLFELRRAVGQLVSPIGDTASVRHDENLLELFNAYQSTVRKGEPFMTTAVNKPAREIATYVRSIIGNVGRRQDLQDRRRSTEVGTEADMRVAKEIIDLDEEDQVAIKNIEDNFQMVLEAIRERIRP